MVLLQEYALEIAVGILALCYITTTLVLGLRLRNYKKLCQLIQGGSAEDHILALERRTSRQAEDIKQLASQLHSIKQQLREYPHIWHLSRYNAFRDTGGDLSFSLAIINDVGNGFVLSSIHGREESRTYAKPVEGGKSAYNLSAEEKEALKRALSQA